MIWILLKCSLNTVWIFCWMCADTLKLQKLNQVCYTNSEKMCLINSYVFLNYVWQHCSDKYLTFYSDFFCWIMAELLNFGLKWNNPDIIQSVQTIFRALFWILFRQYSDYSDSIQTNPSDSIQNIQTVFREEFWRCSDKLLTLYIQKHTCWQMIDIDSWNTSNIWQQQQNIQWL